MNVREKLVELFYDNNVRCDQKIEGLADDVMDIISRGVTVQECKLGVKKTNADRIRSMNDEELNDLFNEIYNAGVDDAVEYEWGHRTNSFEWTMEWLQQSAEVIE